MRNRLFCFSRKRVFFSILFVAIAASPLCAKKKSKTPVKDDKIYDLALSADDIVVLPEDESHRVKDCTGVHLFVRKRGDIQSVLLLVDSDNYNDPDLSLMRAKEYNSVNGNEVRYAYGSKSTFRMERTPNALMSSTAENNFFGECFHIYIPKKMYYGYVIQVQDECEFVDGMRVSVRTFASEHCDSSGKFLDNKLNLNVSDWKVEESFSKIASDSDGKVEHVSSAKNLPQKLVEKVDEFDSSEKIDLVFAIDATESMKDDFAELKKNWLSKFEKQMKKFSDARIGLLLYKDYSDEYNLRGLPVKNLGFQKNAGAFSKCIKNVSVKGGGDREEAVLEALYACADGFDWRSDAKKKIILIGDAPPHSEPNEKFSMGFDDVSKMLGEKSISVDCFLISDSEKKNADMKSVEKNSVADELVKSVETLDAK